MSWWGGGEIREMPGMEWRVLAITSSTLKPGSCPPSRLGALGHFDLYLFGMDEVFGRDTEASGGHLFGLAAKRDAFVRFVETAAVFAAFPRVASGTEFVHGQCQGLRALPC